MNRKTAGVAVLILVGSALAPVPAFCQDENRQTLAGAITTGKASIGFRYRYEFVDQDGFTENANASTVRLRLNYKTGAYRNWSAFGEFDYIGELFLRDFNSLGGSSQDRNRYPVVADPKGPDLNQLYLAYTVSDRTSVKLGRQRIVLNNHRFIGDVGWRQNIQTYDGISVSSKAVPRTDIFYSYVTTVRRIFGDDVAAGRHDAGIHIFNGKIRLADGWSVSPYFYGIDNDSNASFSTSTLGARIGGDLKIGDSQLKLTAELATQSDAANNPVNYSAEYFNLGATLVFQNGLSFGLTWESLGGSQSVSGASFKTPLATLHAFQGWADKFLATPNEGINDLYATVKYKFGKWNLAGVYHDFSAEAGNADWGTEINVSAGRSLGDRYGIVLKGAFYSADQWATDTDKFWVMLTGRY